MALAGMPRTWLLSLPESSVASWEELRRLFATRFAVPAHHAIAAIFGDSQVPALDRHTKQFFCQIGAPPSLRGAPPGWVAP